MFVRCVLLVIFFSNSLFCSDISDWCVVDNDLEAGTAETSKLLESKSDDEKSSSDKRRKPKVNLTVTPQQQLGIISQNVTNKIRLFSCAGRCCTRFIKWFYKANDKNTEE